MYWVRVSAGARVRVRPVLNSAPFPPGNRAGPVPATPRPGPSAPPRTGARAAAAARFRARARPAYKAGRARPRACRPGGRAVTKPAMTRVLRQLEAEAIHAMRETAAAFRRPVMLYSAGKDSSVMLHLARKAFEPEPLPFPLLHVDTTWKFPEMYEFRDRAAREAGAELVVHVNREGLARGFGPFTHDPSLYTDVMKTQALRQALDAGGHDAALGGARRDEERSRAKERVFSVRGTGHGWNPRAQRPELWRLYNTRLGPDETMRVFPLSNWTELDVWRYVLAEEIPVVPLYFARPRPVVERAGALIAAVDGRLPLGEGEAPVERVVRFRTLGCWPLTGAVESEAADVASIVAEMEAARTSERAGRLIDHDRDGSMERKKREGYF